MKLFVKRLFLVNGIQGHDDLIFLINQYLNTDTIDYWENIKTIDHMHYAACKKVVISKTMIALLYDQKVCVVSLITKCFIAEIDGEYKGMAFSTDGKMLATGNNRMFIIWHTSSWHKIFSYANDVPYPIHHDEHIDFHFLMDDTRVLYGVRHVLKIVSLRPRVATYEMDIQGVLEKISPNGQIILSFDDCFRKHHDECQQCQSINLYKMDDSQSCVTIARKHTTHYSSAFSPDSEYLLIDGPIDSLTLYSVRTGEQVKTFHLVFPIWDIIFLSPHVVLLPSKSVLGLLDSNNRTQILPKPAHGRFKMAGDGMLVCLSRDCFYTFSASYLFTKSNTSLGDP